MLDIDTPVLTTLLLHGWIIYLKINCPSLFSLSTTCVYAEDDVEDKHDKLMRRWRRLEILKMDDMEILELICGFDARCKEHIPSPFSDVRKNPSCFAGLCKLSIGINLNFTEHACVLTFILNRRTHLQELHLAQEVRHKFYSSSTIWSRCIDLQEVGDFISQKMHSRWFGGSEASPTEVLLEGSPGVGKTSLAVVLAQHSGHSIVRINLSEQVEDRHDGSIGIRLAFSGG